jgi:hypothetical protein
VAEQEDEGEVEEETHVSGLARRGEGVKRTTEEMLEALRKEASAQTGTPTEQRHAFITAILCDEPERPRRCADEVLRCLNPFRG